MLESLLLSAAGAVIPEAVRYIEGSKQITDANKINNSLVRPTMKVPPANQEALNITRMLAASRGMPGYGAAKEEIEASGANNLLMEGMSGNPNVETAYRNKTRALLDLGVSDSQFRTNMTSNLVGELDKMGGIQQDIFKFNKVDPYYEDVQRSAEIKDAGQNNEFNALRNVSGIGENLLTTNYALNSLDKIYNNPAAPGATNADNLKVDGGNVSAGSGGSYSVYPIFGAKDGDPRMLDGANPFGTNQTGFNTDGFNMVDPNLRKSQSIEAQLARIILQGY